MMCCCASLTGRAHRNVQRRIHRTFVTRADGSEVVTIRAADGRVLRRALIQVDGSRLNCSMTQKNAPSTKPTPKPRAASRDQRHHSTEAHRAALAAEMASR
jgi:hypothetical protein